MLDNDPELDLMIIDLLGVEYRSSASIALELQLPESVIIKALKDLIDCQIYTIDKSDLGYKVND
jgi:hypothetical protein